MAPACCVACRSWAAAMAAANTIESAGCCYPLSWIVVAAAAAAVV